MHAPTLPQSAPRSTAESWADDNERGLTLAAEGEWSAAADAFAAAADDVSLNVNVASHEAMALLLSNLAQACFRAGRRDDGIKHAQRACSLRAALVGEDAVTVARARADLAVMLGSVGRADDGLGLIARAIGSIERSAGEDDRHLLSVLENAGRLALAAGQPSAAEPYLLRLHALLADHERPTDVAERLLARVATARRELPVAAPTPDRGEVPANLFVDASADVPADALASDFADDLANGLAASLPSAVRVDGGTVQSVEMPLMRDTESQDTPETALIADWGMTASEPAVAPVTPERSASIPSFDDGLDFDDQPLRDAVVVTDVLLRNTPVSSRAILPLMDLISDTPQDTEHGTEHGTEQDAALHAALQEMPQDTLRTPSNVVGVEFDLADEFASAQGSPALPPAIQPDVHADVGDIVGESRSPESEGPDGRTPRAAAEDVYGSVMFDLVDAPAPTPTASPAFRPTEMPVPSRPDSLGDMPPSLLPAHDSLGFAFDYGMPSDASPLNVDDVVIAPPTSVRVPTPPSIPAMPGNTPVPSHGASRASSPAPVPPRATGDESAPARAREPRGPRPTVRPEAPQRSRGVLVAVGVLVPVAAAVGWFFLRGGL